MGRIMTDTITARHGQRLFRRIGERDHINRYGRQAVVAIWQSNCVVCGQPFEVVASHDATEKAHALQTKTCLAHRIRKFGNWSVVQVDPVGRRALCVKSRSRR
jgi:hypothetical protein